MIFTWVTVHIIYKQFVNLKLSFPLILKIVLYLQENPFIPLCWKVIQTFWNKSIFVKKYLEI